MTAPVSAYAVARPPGHGQAGDRIVLPLDVDRCDGTTIEGRHHVPGARRGRRTYTLGADAFEHMAPARAAAARATNRARARGEVRCVMPDLFQDTRYDYHHGRRDGIATLEVTDYDWKGPEGLPGRRPPRERAAYARHGEGRFENLLRDLGLAWSHEGIVQPRWIAGGTCALGEATDAIRTIGSFGRILTYERDWLGAAETIILLPRPDGRVEAASVFAAILAAKEGPPAVGMGAFDVATLDIGWADALRLRFAGALRLLCRERPIPDALADRTDKFGSGDRLRAETRAMLAAIALDKAAEGGPPEPDWEVHARIDASGPRPEVRLTRMGREVPRRPVCDLVARVIASSPAARVMRLGHKPTYMKRRPAHTRLSSFRPEGDDATFASIRAPASATLRAAWHADMASGPGGREAAATVRSYLAAAGAAPADLDAALWRR